MAEDLDLDTLIPLLMQQQRQNQSVAASKAALGLAGRMVAPNLTDMLANPSTPRGLLPAPGTVGKVPPQSGMDPRVVPAMAEIGSLAAGGLAGRMMAPTARAATMAGSATEDTLPQIGKVVPSIDQSGIGRTLVGAGLLTPDSQAQAAGMKLPYDERVKLEAARRAQEQMNQAEAAKTEAANKAALDKISAEAEISRKNQAAQAELQRQLEAQQRADAEATAKAEREKPFREKHAVAAQMMPIAGMAASTAIPFAKGLASKVPLNRFVNDWENVGQTAQQALKGRAKVPATLAVNQLKDFENQWPAMEKRYTPGLGETALTSIIPAEMAAFPTEYDAMTQPSGSAGRPTVQDWLETLGRSGIAGAAGTGASKLGASMVPKTRPYVGGQGIIGAYNQKYPTKVTKAQRDIAKALKIP